MGDITGTTFAGYQVRDVIDTDLVSTLYRATEPDDERTVSLRVVARDLCVVEGSDRELYRRFLGLATASLTFEHDNSPQVEQVGEHFGQAYLVAPFVDAMPLSQYVEEHRRLSTSAAVDLIAQIADVLDAAHEAGLTHGAVNPSTLVVSRPVGDAPPALAYLIGYGVGALLELRLKRDRRQLTVVDDLLYVAPEQLRQQKASGRSDQYALACALVHLLTGSPPFERDSIGGLFGAHLFVEPELDTAAAWTQPLRRALAKEPEERFATCGDLVAAVSAEVAAAQARVVETRTLDEHAPDRRVTNEQVAAASTRMVPSPSVSPRRPSDRGAAETQRESMARTRSEPAARAHQSAASRDDRQAADLGHGGHPVDPGGRGHIGDQRDADGRDVDERDSDDGGVGASDVDEHGIRERDVNDRDVREREVEEYVDDYRLSPAAAELRNGSRNGSGVYRSVLPDDDAPLLSEVLSQHDRRGGALRPMLWILLVLALLAVAAFVVRFVVL